MPYVLFLLLQLICKFEIILNKKIKHSFHYSEAKALIYYVKFVNNAHIFKCIYHYIQ